MTIRESLKLIDTKINILHIAEHYFDLRQIGRNYTTRCPFCSSKTGFSVSPSKNIFKCFRCQKGGDPIRFIMAYEDLTFTEAIPFIRTKFHKTLGIDQLYPLLDDIRGDIYVLELEGAKFYIGFTTNFHRRMKQHFDGGGAIWTTLHKPIKVLEHHEGKSIIYENILTEKYIKKYGYASVRGGDHIYWHSLYGEGRSMFSNI